MEQFHVDINSKDCIQLYPLNNGCEFRVVMDESLVLKNGKRWSVALVGLTVNCDHDDMQVNGRELYVCSNIVDFSVVGGKKVQLLRKICLGDGVRTAEGGRMFSVDTVENCCFYKRVYGHEIKCIHIYSLSATGKRATALIDCTVGVTLHFKCSN
jgi:hypothetical protein